MKIDQYSKQIFALGMTIRGEVGGNYETFKRRIHKYLLWIVIISSSPLYILMGRAFRSVFGDDMAAVMQGLVMAASMLIVRRIVTVWRRAIILGVERAENPCELGHLAEALAWEDPEIDKSVSMSLFRIFPVISNEHILDLSTAQKRNLYRGLNSGDSMLILALLDIIQRVGDQDACTYVEQLAASGFCKLNTEVCEKVHQTLSCLHQRSINQHISQSHLRASAPPTDSLLRLCLPDSKHDQQQLIRPLSSGTILENPVQSEQNRNVDNQRNRNLR